MKNHREMFEALLAGETLINNKGDCLYFNNLELYLASEEYVGKAGSISVKFPEHWKIKPKTININGFEVNVSSSDIVYLNQIFSKLKAGEDHPLSDSRMKAVITFLEKEYP